MTAPFLPSPAVRRVLARSSEIAAPHGGLVSTTDLSQALQEAIATPPPDPTLIALLGRLTLTNGQLAQLNGNLQEVLIAMSTITDLKTAADALAASEATLSTEVGSLTTAVEGLVTVVGTLRAGGALSAADQASLDSAVQEVTNTSTDLATQTASLSTEQAHAQSAATPPPPGP